MAGQRKFTPHAYHKLSAAEKERHARDKLREPPVLCPVCETQTTPEDLPEHVRVRCMGKRAPHPRSKWVSWKEALGMGVLPGTLAKWVRRGAVRVEGRPWKRQYLLRDIARLKSFRSETSQKPPATTRTYRKATSKRLTKGHSKDLRWEMEQLSIEKRKRLGQLAQVAGGVAALARKVDIPAPTLRKAMAGANLRRGTRVLIEQQLATLAE